MLKVTANENKTFSCSFFSLRVNELTSSRVNELFVTIMIRVIRVIRSLLVYELQAYELTSSQVICCDNDLYNS